MLCSHSTTTVAFLYCMETFSNTELHYTIQSRKTSQDITTLSKGHFPYDSDLFETTSKGVFHCPHCINFSIVPHISV